MSVADVFVSPSLIGQFVILIEMDDVHRNSIDPKIQETYKEEIAAAARLALGLVDFDSLWNVAAQNIAGSEESFAFAFVKKDRSLELAGGALNPVVFCKLQSECKYCICFTELRLSRPHAVSFRSTVFNNVLSLKRSTICHLSLVPTSSVKQQQQFYVDQFGDDLESCLITCSPPFAQTSTDAETLFYDLACFSDYFRIRAEREK